MPTVHGTIFDDTLQAFDGPATIFGLGGNDLFNTGAYADQIIALGGNDTVNAGAGDNNVLAGGGNNVVNTDGGRDTIIALGGDDTVNSGAGNDAIDAGHGNNIVNAGDGHDTVVSGNGIDIVDLGSGNNLAITGGGADRIIGGDGHDTVIAGAGDDVVHVNDGRNHVEAGSGNDVVTAGDGSDTIFGEDGSDTLHANNGDNYVNGGAGDDTMTAGRGNDTMFGGDGNDLIDADRGDNLVYGHEGNDNLTTGSGNDTVDGGAGDDVVVTDRGDDVVFLGSGTNTATLGAGDDLAIVHWADLATGMNRIAGNGGRDTLEIVLTDAEADTAKILQNLAFYRDYGAKIANLRATNFEAFRVVDGNGNAVDIDRPFLDVNRGDKAAISVSEGAGLGVGTSGSATVTASDPNIGEPLTLTVGAVKSAGVTAGLTATNAELAAMLSFTTPLAGAAIVDNNVTWTFDSRAQGFDYLAAGQQLTLTYTVTLADSRGVGDTRDLTVKVVGSNDAPDIVNAAVKFNLTETDAGLTRSFALDVRDPDIADKVTMSVASVAATGPTGGLSNADFKAMLKFSGTVIEADPTHSGNAPFAFDSGAQAFDFLAAGEKLTLAYTVAASDGNGGTDTHPVTVVVTGSNDAVKFFGGGDVAALTETDAGLTTSGALTVRDADLTDNAVLSVADVVVTGDADGLAKADILGMLSLGSGTSSADPTAVDNVAWLFDSGAEAFDWLDAGETLAFDYTVRASDGATAATETVRIEIAGTADKTAPIPTHPVPAGATVIDFENTPNYEAPQVANVLFGNLTAINEGPGYVGATSGTNVGINSYGTTASFFSANGANFDLIDANFLARYKDGLTVTVVGWGDGLMKYQETFTISKDGPTHHEFDWKGVDEIQYVGSGANGGHNQIAIDDITLIF